MAVLLEMDVKRELAREGVAVPAGRVCRSAAQAAEAARGLGGGCVVKALIPTGRKGKGGGIRMAAGPAEAEDQARGLLGRVVNGFPVEAVLVEERAGIAEELYVSIAPDGPSRRMRLMFSRFGGVEIEQRLARGDVESVYLEPSRPPREYEVRSLLARAGVNGRVRVRAAQAVYAIARAAHRLDATLLEVNPLAVLQDGRIMAVGAMCSIDDHALFRHPDLATDLIKGVDRIGRPQRPLEQHMDELNRRFPHQGEIRFAEFADGDIGFMVMGGGAGLVALDALAREGGAPATFFDMTSGDVEEKIYHATKAVLSVERIRGLIIGVNISAFAPVPIRVRGIARALRESGRDLDAFPVVLRLAGPDDDKARALMREFPQVRYFTDDATIEEAVVELCDRVRGAA